MILILSNRDCLRRCINESQEAEVKCPHNDDKFDCGSVIEEREIRAVSQCTIPIPRPLFHLLLIIHTIELIARSFVETCSMHVHKCTRHNCILSDTLNRVSSKFHAHLSFGMHKWMII